jgi:50S ribosomal subunit-associated GTPase HflX
MLREIGDEQPLLEVYNKIDQVSETPQSNVTRTVNRFAYG